MTTTVPKPQSCYACLYALDEEKNFFALVGVKNFSYSRVLGRKVQDMGQAGPFAIFNNPGQHVFPGGQANTGESILHAGLREFHEETAVEFTILDGSVLETVVGDDKLKCLYHVKKFTQYNALYINIPSKEMLDMLAGKINKKIKKDLTLSDELEKVVVIELLNYHERKMHSSFVEYCKNYLEVLSTPKTHEEWKIVFDETKLLADLPKNFTKKTSDVEKFGVYEFAKENYNIKPFLQKLKAQEFDLLTKKYALMKPYNRNGPARFSTDWFCTIAETITAAHEDTLREKEEWDVKQAAAAAIAAERAAEKAAADAIIAAEKLAAEEAAAAEALAALELEGGAAAEGEAQEHVFEKIVA